MAKMKSIFLCIFLLICCGRGKVDRENISALHSPQVVQGREAPSLDSMEVFIDLKNQALFEHKKLFMVFSFQACRWCRVFDQFHKDSQVKAILTKYFIITDIDVNTTRGGSMLCATYGKPGFPSWSILDSDGKVITDSDKLRNGSSNVGYPHHENDISYYIRSLKMAAPGITASECKLLAVKIREYGKRNV
jgi:thioredoxin-related protein